MRESGRVPQILSLGWDLQQLAMHKKTKTKNTQREWNSTDPYPTSNGPCPQTHTQRVSHRKTEDTRTHWSTDTHSCPQNLTSRSRHKQASQMKALAAHKSPVTAPTHPVCLPSVCRVMDSPNQMMLEDTCDFKWSTIDSSAENDLQLTSLDYPAFSSPFFNRAPLNSLLSSKFGLLGRGKSGKWAVKTI